MIQLDQVHKRYSDGERENHVLRGLSLTVEPGEVVALTGPSGSGKSTLLNLLGAMDQDYEGQVVVAGQELKRLGDRELSAFRNATVSFVFQHFHLLGHLPALANVTMPAFFNPKASIDEARSRGVELLQRVGLGDRLEALPGQLSGGERQRVAIARALANRPRLLLADEPTGALDSQHGSQVLEVLESLSRDEGVTVVIVTHDGAVSARCDREIRISDGQLVVPGGGS